MGFVYTWQRVQINIEEADLAILSGSDSTASEKRDRFFALAETLRDSIWRADALGRSRVSAISTGYAALDTELPGQGWNVSVLTELLWAYQGGGEFRVLAPALKMVSQAGKTVVLLGSPHELSAPALDQYGIDIKHLLIVHADKPADRLWTAEQILRSASAGALVSWHPAVKAEHLRRLQVAAAAVDSLTFILRPASTKVEPSPSPLRLHCEPAPYGQLSVDVFKRRGPAAAAPVLLPALFSPSMKRALDRAQRNAVAPPVESSHVDRLVPSPAAARPGIPTLA
ncbi:translesion DNA synthesis-associated protein ImuA [Noviherbaspirillum malthae]|uniref:translesion DNA synthesis-associated protein ImuA n=1 Tax=Noviherbaspirillum malthae TaxID=1260987 RepID=UPI00188DD2A8|nr:translesion DNA synthesis-associated protein ImuA [Noviherbaspirillum malthae]